MIKQKEIFNYKFREFNQDPTYADIVQQFTENELLKIIQDYDGWIVGDDPCTRQVLEHGSKGKLKAIVKWGVGIDNVDFQACKDLGLPAINTPGMFGAEVADMAIGYLINLSRKIIQVHNGVKNGEWIKPTGTSLSGKNVGIVGFGDIGKNIAKRLEIMGLNVFVYDPYAENINSNYIHLAWPDNVQNLDILILACALNQENKHLIRKQVIDTFKNEMYLVNVSRGKLIHQVDLVKALSDGKFAGVALDVYEDEPITKTNQLHEFDRVIFGTHNGSNTSEAVQRTSLLAIEQMRKFLNS